MVETRWRGLLNSWPQWGTISRHTSTTMQTRTLQKEEIRGENARWKRAEKGDWTMVSNQRTLAQWCRPSTIGAFDRGREAWRFTLAVPGPVPARACPRHRDKWLSHCTSTHVRLANPRTKHILNTVLYAQSAVLTQLQWQHAVHARRRGPNPAGQFKAELRNRAHLRFDSAALYHQDRWRRSKKFSYLYWWHHYEVTEPCDIWHNSTQHEQCKAADAISLRKAKKRQRYV